jgi:hypothetical protein
MQLILLREIVFIVRTIQNTQICPVGGMQSFSTLLQVVHIEALGSKGIINQMVKSVGLNIHAILPHCIHLQLLT